MFLLAAAWLQVRVELSDEQRELYKAILGRNYSALVGEFVHPSKSLVHWGSSAYVSCYY